MLKQNITLIDLQPDENGEQRPPFKVPLGETVIGREPFLQCTHLAVSRTHAKLEVKEPGELILTSIHKKPSYYQRQGDMEKSVLNINESVRLHDGDTFYMIDSGAGYRVQIKDLLIDETEKTEDNKEGLESEELPLVVENISPTSAAKRSPKKRKFPEWMEGAQETKANPVINKRVERVEHEESGSRSESCLEAKAAETDLGLREESSKMQRKYNSDEEEAAEEEKQQVKAKQNVTAAVHNLSDVEDSEEPTNILDLNENGNESELIAEQQTETREQASESVDEQADATLSDQDEDAQQSTSAQATQRPSCKYAERCYRQNPQHKIDFSHPGDADFVSLAPAAPGPKPACPYGSSCYRKNPQHVQDYDHTQPPSSPPSSPTKRAPRQTRKKQKAKKNKDADDSEDSYESSFIDDDDSYESSDEYNPDEDTDEDWE